MRVVVLSRSKRIASTKRIVAAAQARGHSVRVVNPAQVALLLGGPAPRLQHRSKLLAVPDVVIPRIASSLASYALPVLDQFQLRGAVALNSARAIGQSRNPARCLQRLSSHGVEIPRTVMARDASQLKTLVDRVGGVPVLVKLLHGPERRGVMICESEQSLAAALEAVLGLGRDVVMQEYVRGSGRDLRVFAVGGRAVAAVRRKARSGLLSPTLSKLARMEPVTLDPAVTAVAERAAQVSELDVCAVDLLQTKAGDVKVFEVNASPSLPDLEQATRVDLADLMVRHAEALFEKHLAQRGPPVASSGSPVKKDVSS